MNALRGIAAKLAAVFAVACTVVIAACSGGGGTAPAAPAGVSPTATAPTAGATATPVSTATPTSAPTSAASPTSAATSLPGLNARLHLQNGFYGNMIAQIPEPRELVALPNGDLLVGSKASSGSSSTVYLVPNADGLLAAGKPVAFVTIPDTEAQGVAFSASTSMIFVATTHGVWKIPYRTGDQAASGTPVEIVKVRTGPVAPNSDGDVHSTTSVAVSGSYLFTSVGSSCNRCAEVDPTRAVVLRTDLSGGGQFTVATRIRNAIALATNSSTGAVWAGGAGQDCLVPTVLTSCGGQNDAYQDGHPYEYMDPVTLHGSATADYGWPDCEEDRHAYTMGATCTSTVVPKVESPAYSTIIGATFYGASAAEAYAFPSSYDGGMFMTFHGSWHEGSNGIPVAVPNVVFVPMNGDSPVTAIDWSAPVVTSQWSAFLTSYQDPQGDRFGQPSGVAVGPQGSLFIADDLEEVVYRVRPGTPPAGAARSRLR